MRQPMMRPRAFLDSLHDSESGSDDVGRCQEFMPDGVDTTTVLGSDWALSRDHCIGQQGLVDRSHAILCSEGNEDAGHGPVW